MPDRPYNVLFLCTGNTARSILSESALTHWGKGRFRGFSAGSHPKGIVNPFAISLLRNLGYPLTDLRSKSWDEFAAPGAPAMDCIITVCDNAAGESCPVWPGHPVSAHWGVPDPAAADGSDIDKAAAFSRALQQLESRIKPFAALPIATLDRPTLQRRMAEIGKTAV